MIEQPRVNHFFNPDVIIDESGQTWVKDQAGLGAWSPYVKIEEIRAKDYDCNRNTRQRPSGRFGTRGGRPSNGYAGSGYYFDESGESFPHSGSKLNDQIRIHAMLEEWFAKIREADGK